MVEYSFDTKYPAVVNCYYIPDLGITKISLHGTQAEIKATTDLLQKDGNPYIVLDDAQCINFSMTWGNTAPGPCEDDLYKLWLLVKGRVSL